MRHFTPEEDQFIEDHYLSLPAYTIDKLLGRVKNSVRQRMQRLGLIVPDEIKAGFIEGSFYKKGLTPINKGRKMIEWANAEAIQKIKSTQFKKGHTPKNTLFDNAVVKRKDKTGIIYLYVRVSLSFWMPLQRYVWEQVHGQIPKAHNIIFKDRNTLNCNLDNLEMISNADLLNRNSAHRFGPEIFKIIQLRGALNRQINKRLKQLSNEK
jgi:hypothetical protein